MAMTADRPKPTVSKPAVLKPVSPRFIVSDSFNAPVIVSQPSESLYTLELNDGLTDAEVEEAYDIIRWLQGSGQFYGIAGLMLVTGMPRQGKGLFGNAFAYKIKHLFKGKRILRDDHPKAAFGGYSLFNEDILNEDIARMRDIAVADLPTEIRSGNKKAKAQMMSDVKNWNTEQGEVLFKNSIALLDEFWRYMNNRRPMTPMNLALSGIIKMWGHLDCLMMGLAQRQHDLDRFTCLPYVTHEARCAWCQDRENTVQVMLYRVQFSSAKQALVPIGRPTRIFVDGGKVRPELGGRRYFDLYNSKAAPLFQFAGLGGRRETL